MFTEDIKNKLNDLAIRGMNDSESYGINPQFKRSNDIAISLKRTSPRRNSIQLKLFEL